MPEIAYNTCSHCGNQQDAIPADFEYGVSMQSLFDDDMQDKQICVACAFEEFYEK